MTDHPYRGRITGVLLTLAVLIPALSVLVSVPTPLHGDSQPDEYRVKAAYIYHFAELVEWPPEARNSSTLDLCVVGEDPFHGDLESAVEGKPIGGQVIHVQHIKNSTLANHCQIIFFGKNENKQTTSLLAELRNAPVVTVGEADNFLQQGGVIRFCLVSNKIRFEINLRAAEAGRLKISSRLLSLAVNMESKR